MIALILFFVVVPILIAWAAAYFISRTVRHRLNAEGHKHAKTIAIITYVLSFIIILAVIFILINNNVNIGR